MESTTHRIILFRFHDNPEIAAERLKILKYFNPNLPVYVLYGGKQEQWEASRNLIDEFVVDSWIYPYDKDKDWKWQHTDLMLKEWYRQVGSGIAFDHLYSYEYDLLIAGPLEAQYPDVDQDTIALAACSDFSEAIERGWTWTSQEPYRQRYMEFNAYLQATYGITRQQKVCLGPAPLFSKKFLDAWSKTEDVEYVHDELAYPAYAEALGFKAIDHGMHPGFGKSREEQQYFNCYGTMPVQTEAILVQLETVSGVRAFHPVKQQVTLDEITAHLATPVPVQSH